MSAGLAKALARASKAVHDLEQLQDMSAPEAHGIAEALRELSEALGAASDHAARTASMTEIDELRDPRGRESR